MFQLGNWALGLGLNENLLLFSGVYSVVGHRASQAHNYKSGEC